VIKLRSGAWCMVLNDTEDGRHRLSAWLSEDEGKTWPWKRTLENHPPKSGGYSYPSLIQTRDGFIHVTYSSSSRQAPAAPELQTIKHVKFTAEWVKQAGGTEGPKVLAALEDLKDPVEGVVTTYNKPFSAKDHEAITANIPVFGEVKGQHVVYAYPDDQKTASMVRVKDVNAKGALVIKK